MCGKLGMRVVGEVAGLTVKNSTPWNNIWIANRSHDILMLISITAAYNLTKQLKLSWFIYQESIEHFACNTDSPGKFTQFIDLCRGLKDFLVLKTDQSLLKLPLSRRSIAWGGVKTPVEQWTTRRGHAIWIEGAPEPMVVAFDPQLKRMSSLKVLSPTTSLTDVPPSCEPQIKGWRSALKGEALYPVTPPQRISWQPQPSVVTVKTQPMNVNKVERKCSESFTCCTNSVNYELSVIQNSKGVTQ